MPACRFLPCPSLTASYQRHSHAVSELSYSQISQSRIVEPVRLP
jgi:hypothetical protein